MENISPAIDNTTIPFFQETKTFLQKDTITSISDVNYDSQIRRKIIIEITNSLPNTPIPVTKLFKNYYQNYYINLYINTCVPTIYTHSSNFHSVNETTGEISVSGTLDHNAAAVIILTVSVTDNNATEDFPGQIDTSKWLWLSCGYCL